MPFRDLPGAERCYFHEGESLISIDEQLQHVYYLVSGVVYRVVITENGDETILSRKTGGEGVSSLIGILVAYSEPGFHPIHEFVAHTDCVCYRIPITVCTEYLHDHPELLEAVLRECVREYVYLSKKYWVKKDKNAPAELCGFLLDNSYVIDGERVLSRQYTNIEIAKFISVHRVTVTNMLRALKDEGCVERVSRGLRLIDVPRLQEYRDRKRTLNY